jgi:hypothetical protein
MIAAQSVMILSIFLARLIVLIGFAVCGHLVEQYMFNASERT